MSIFAGMYVGEQTNDSALRSDYDFNMRDSTNTSQLMTHQSARLSSTPESRSFDFIKFPNELEALEVC